MTDGDKTGESTSQDNRVEGLDMTDPESIAIVLEFFSLVCSEGKMRNWLGKEGSNFWLPLLTLLSDRPIEKSCASTLRQVIFTKSALVNLFSFRLKYNLHFQ